MRVSCKFFCVHATCIHENITKAELFLKQGIALLVFSRFTKYSTCSDGSISSITSSSYSNTFSTTNVSNIIIRDDLDYNVTFTADEKGLILLGQLVKK